MHPWACRARFRRAAFGWKGSKLAIERIHEALAEICAVAHQVSDLAAAAMLCPLTTRRTASCLNSSV